MICSSNWVNSFREASLNFSLSCPYVQQSGVKHCSAFTCTAVNKEELPGGDHVLHKRPWHFSISMYWRWLKVGWVFPKKSLRRMCLPAAGIASPAAVWKGTIIILQQAGTEGRCTDVTEQGRFSQRCSQQKQQILAWPCWVTLVWGLENMSP